MNSEINGVMSKRLEFEYFNWNLNVEMAQEMTMFNKGLEGRELTCNKCTPSVKNNQSFFRYYTHLFTGKMRFIRKVFLFFNYLNVKNHKNPRFPY